MGGQPDGLRGPMPSRATAGWTIEVPAGSTLDVELTGPVTITRARVP